MVKNVAEGEGNVVEFHIPVPDCGVRDPAVCCICQDNYCSVCSLWHRLHTVIAVPRLTQPSTLLGKWDSKMSIRLLADL